MKQFILLLYTGVFFTALQLCSCTKNEQIPETVSDTKPHLNISDSLALIKIYEALGPWDGQRWDYSDYTTWAGLKAAYDVATNEIRAVGLEVFGGIHGDLPDEICDLTELRTLILSGGSGHIPENIGNLRHLTYLSLGENTLTGGIPESIGNLHELKQLRLMNTSLNDTIPESIGNLENLELICIFNTQLRGNVPRGIAHLNNLRYAVFNQNHFSGKFPVEILEGKKVWFSFRDNDITELPWEVWADSYYSEVADLRGNRLSGEIPEWVKTTKKWKEFHGMVGRQQKGYGYTGWD